jgi:hypothetical protein
MPFKSLDQFFYLKKRKPKVFRSFMAEEASQMEKQIIKRLARKKKGTK